MREVIKFLRNKIINILGRAVIEAAKQDPDTFKIIMQVSVFKDDINSNVELLQAFGFRAFPLEGSRGILFAYAGDKDNVTGGLYDDKRFGKVVLQPGESIQYCSGSALTKHTGDKVLTTADTSGEVRHSIGNAEFLLQNGLIRMTVDGNVFTMTASKTTMSKPLEVDGTIDTTGVIRSDIDVVSDTISGKSHLTTGVTTGTGVSGPPQ